MSDRKERATVRVAVRLRPMNNDEKKLGVTPVITASEEHKTISVMKGEDMSRSTYSFDNVFNGFASQKEVFQGTLFPMIQDVLKGYESTVFAYGQTGTGKTHTMEGDLSDPVRYGVIPRTTDAIFNALRKKKYKSYKVTCSYLEIYNEELSDLLAYPDSNTKIEILNKKSGTFCRGLTEKEVNSSEDVLNLMLKAVQSRKIGETKMNKQSSRSHCVFTVSVHITEEKENETFKYLGKLHMVDLAGSECAKNTQIGSRTSVTGSARERERLNINRSLLTLGRVISAVKDMSHGRKNIRVPYRDSKLTRILQEALGGRCRTLVIATVSPSETALSESLSTLNYAQTANGITNKPVASSYHHAHSSYNSPSTIMPDPTGAVEQWFELECKLKYMEAQIEEANLALSRKEMQQEMIIERAERSEQALQLLEVELHQTRERIDVVEEEFEMEKKKCEVLTDTLHKTEESLVQTTAKLEASRKTEGNLRERIGVLEEEFEMEKEKCEVLTDNLHRTEDALIKTSAILEASRKTEENLTSEAKMLIDTIKESLQEGDELYQLLLDSRHSEIYRREATQDFHGAAASILEDISSKIDTLGSAEEAYRKKLVANSTEDHNEDTESLKASFKALKDINVCVKNLSKNIKELATGSNGVLPTVISLIGVFEEKVKGSETLINKEEEVLASSILASSKKVSQYQKEVIKMDAKFHQTSDELCSAIEHHGTESNEKIGTMVSELIQAISAVSDLNRKTREDLSVLLKNIQTASLNTMDHIERQASEQHSKTEDALESFVDGMKQHEVLKTELNDQSSFVSTEGKSQLELLASQAAMLSTQKKIFAEAKEMQKKMQEDLVSRVLNGMQQMLSSEMMFLWQENEARYDALKTDNGKMIDLNSTIESSTNVILDQVKDRSDSLLGHAEKLHKMDKNVYDEMEEANTTVLEIKEEAHQHQLLLSDTSTQTNEKIKDLTNLEPPVTEAMDKLEEDSETVTMYVQDSLLNTFDRGIQNLMSQESSQIDILSKGMVPTIHQDFDDMLCKRGEVRQVLSTRWKEIHDRIASGKDEVKGIIEAQCDQTDQLHKSVTSQCSNFSSSNMVPRKAEIDARHAEALEHAENHYEMTSGHLTVMQSLVNQTEQDINDYTNDVIHMDQKVPELQQRAEIKLNEKLSSTEPAEDIIVAVDQGKLTPKIIPFHRVGENKLRENINEEYAEKSGNMKQNLRSHLATSRLKSPNDVFSSDVVFFSPKDSREDDDVLIEQSFSPQYRDRE